MSSVALGQILAQVVALFATPILTRLFLPSDFALLAVFIGAVVLITCVSTWRFDYAVPIARPDSLASACMVLGLTTAACLPVVGIAVLLMGPQLPGEFGRLSEHASVALLLGVASFCAGSDLMLQSWFTRTGNIQILGLARVLQAVATAGVSILLWYWTGSGLGLVGGMVAGYVASILVGLLHSGSLAVQLARVRLSSMRRAFRRFRFYTSLSVASTVNQAIVTTLMPVLLLFFHTPTEVGWFSLVQRLAVGPVGFISHAVMQSFWSEASQLIHKDPAQLRTLYLRMTRFLALLALPLMAACALGPWFVGPLLGREDWDGAGWVLVAIIPMVFGLIAVSPLNHLVTHDRAGWVLGWDMGRAFAIGTTTALVAYFGESFFLTVLTLSTMHLLSYLTLVLLHLRSFALILQRRPGSGIQPAPESPGGPDDK